MATRTLEGKVLHSEALVGATGAGNDGSIGDKRVVNPGERHEVSLKFGQVDVEGTVKAETGCDRADNLGNQTVQVVEAGTGNVELTVADIVDGLIVNQERTI